MRRFSSLRQTCRFCHAHDPIYGHFRPQQHQLTAADHRTTLTDRHRTWNEITMALFAERAAAT